MSGMKVNVEKYPTDPFYIKATHSAAFRSGQWALIVGVGMYPKETGKDRPCYVVAFIDGAMDFWPVYDEAAGYEFSKKATHG